MSSETSQARGTNQNALYSDATIPASVAAIRLPISVWLPSPQTENIQRFGESTRKILRLDWSLLWPENLLVKLLPSERAPSIFLESRVQGLLDRTSPRKYGLRSWHVEEFDHEVTIMMVSLSNLASHDHKSFS